MTTPFHSDAPLPLRLTLKAAAAQKDGLHFAACPVVSPAFRTVTVTLDGKTTIRAWESGEPVAFEFKLTQGVHRLTIDLGGSWPAGVVTLPRTTESIAGILPTIADPATALADPETPWLAPKATLPQLTSIFPSAFVRNTHRTSFALFFAGARQLAEIPEALFFPTTLVRSFAGTFAYSGLRRLSGQQFNCTPLATDFSDCFRATPLATVPEELFSETPLARNFTRTFADSELSVLPEGLFASVACEGLYTETFARTRIAQVPAHLMSRCRPLDVDGMFAPRGIAPSDPLYLKTAAHMPPEFLRDTVRASGVPTKAFDRF